MIVEKTVRVYLEGKIDGSKELEEGSFGEGNWLAFAVLTLPQP